MKSALKVLMVGNSFSLSCRSYLPDIVKSLPNCKLKLEIAFIGGCSLERHVQEYENSQQNPEHRPYFDISDQPASLQEFLERDQWDIISIQQASHFSWQPATYQPWAEKLIGIIRETNPQAEIVIQQTWSYNKGNVKINTPDEWGLDQAGMFSCLDAAYRMLSRQYDFRVVPTGLAVQLTRNDSPCQLPRMDEEMKKSLAYPSVLPETEDAVGICHYKDDENSGKILCADTIHLNSYGQYLQGCVWAGFLFNISPKNITFEPVELPDKARLAKYRAAADQALREYRR